MIFSVNQCVISNMFKNKSLYCIPMMSCEHWICLHTFKLSHDTYRAHRDCTLYNIIYSDSTIPPRASTWGQKQEATVQKSYNNSYIIINELFEIVMAYLLFTGVINTMELNRSPDFHTLYTYVILNTVNVILIRLMTVHQCAILTIFTSDKV